MISRLLSSRACAIAGMALLVGAGSLISESIVSSDGDVPAPFTIDEFGLRSGGPGAMAEAVLEQVAATYHGVFRATVYYTPMEVAFKPEAGFDMTPETRRGLHGRKFPREFLKAVEVEGFGRMKETVGDKRYLCCCRGRWSYADSPLDSGGQPLLALQSTAVGADYELVRSQANFRVQAAGAPREFLEARWRVSDCGSGLKPCQSISTGGKTHPWDPDQNYRAREVCPTPSAARRCSF